MKPTTRMGISQNVAMTPQLLQSIRLLQLSAIELEQEVETALEGNVLLERDESAPAPTTGSEAPSPVVADTALHAADATDAPVSGCDDAAIERVDADYDWSSAEAWSGGEPTEEGEPLEARRAAAPTEDARVAALEQLELMVSTKREWELVLAIVEAVDDNGYLETSLDAILAGLPAALGASMAELEAALETVQSVEPTGFAARNLRECLLLQLEAVKAGTPGRNLAQTLVMDHLDRVAARDFINLRSELGATEAKMHAAMDLIRTLDPKPGASRVEPAQAVVPDLIISGTAGAWKVELNPVNLPEAAHQRPVRADDDRQCRPAPRHEGPAPAGPLAGPRPGNAPRDPAQDRPRGVRTAARIPQARRRRDAAADLARSGRQHLDARVDGLPRDLEQVRRHALGRLSDEGLFPEPDPGARRAKPRASRCGR